MNFLNSLLIGSAEWSQGLWTVGPLDEGGGAEWGPRGAWILDRGCPRRMQVGIPGTGGQPSPGAWGKLSAPGNSFGGPSR